MNKRILALLLIGSCLKASPQEQLKYEYWFDEAFQLRDAVTTTSGDVKIDVDVSHLTAGIHLFNFRAMDSHNRWSAPSTTCFYVAQNTQASIRKYEYWFDEKYGDRHATSTSNLVLNFDVDVASLTDGIHTFVFRAQSTDGKWSAPSTTMFLKAKKPQTVSVTKYEYWIDGNWAEKHTGANTSGLINIDINVSQLKGGMHCLYFRMQDEQGRWSAPMSHCFVKPASKNNNKIKAYRYWFNGAYEEAATVTLEMPTSPYTLNVNIPVDNIRQHAAAGDTITITMDNGEQKEAVRNFLYLQFQDVYNQWSSVQVDKFATLIDKSLIVPKDLAILAELYRSTDGDSHWQVKWPALDQSIYSNELMGVSAYDGHVTAINLKGNNLHGVFPHIVFGLDSLSVLNLEDNQLSGTLNVQSIPPRLSELYVAGNRLSVLTGPIPETITMLSLFRQDMDITIPFRFNEQSFMDAFEQLPNICLYDQQQHSFSRNATFTLCAEPNDNKPLVYIRLNQGHLTFSLNNSGKIVYDKPSGDTLYCQDELANRFMLTFNYDAGDANFDDIINVQDLSALIMFCLQAYNAPFNFSAANLWKDAVVNVQDAVCLVNILLESMPAATVSSQVSPSRGSSAEEGSTQAILTCSDGLLTLTTPVPVSAFDIVIDNMEVASIKSQLESLGFVISKRQQGESTHLIGYSPVGALIPSGQTVIATIGQNTASIRAALLADNLAHAVRVAFDSTTGIGKKNASIMANVTNGYIQIATSKPLNNVTWKLLSIGGAVLDGGTIETLPIGVNSIPYKEHADGVAILHLTAEGCQPIIKKVISR